MTQNTTSPFLLDPARRPPPDNCPSVVVDFPKQSRLRIALVGGFSPRRCGIATFTTDIYESIMEAYPGACVDIYALHAKNGPDYQDPAVKGVIEDDQPESFRWAARQIEESKADIVWLQHEFGLFGGPAGSDVLTLVESISAPLMVTLHTVLDAPNPDQLAVMQCLVARAARLMVMSEVGREVLVRIYGADPNQIVVIPHGAPDRPFGRTEAFKQKMGLADARILMTFGLISPGKGIEVVISALPAIVARHPNILYCIVGATHPNFLAHKGETYREGLRAQAQALGIADNIRWFDSFLGKEELLDLLEAADIYITPYPGEAQSTSGTLSYAVALGKAVVSTPYVHASELLSDEHGVLVPFNDSAAIADAVTALFDTPDRLLALQQRAYLRGRSMVWSRFAARAMDAILEIRNRATPPALSRLGAPLVPIGFEGVARLTDDTGSSIAAFPFLIAPMAIVLTIMPAR